MQRIVRLCAFLACSLGSTAFAEPITVFAASSLRDAVSEIAQDYESETGDNVTLVFAATSTIARQVAQGAPADVVLLADRTWADWLIEQSIVDDVVPFAGNRLVLIGLQGAVIDDIADLDADLGDGRLAMAQVDAVPAGRYGKAALEALGLWGALEPRVVQAANVRAALRFVERGEAAFGIGYASDLVALPALVEVYRFAADTHPDIIYSGAKITPQGSVFMEHLISRSAQDTLALWGFEPVGDTP